MRTDNLHEIPSDIPVPQDDGATAHLVGTVVPPVLLRSTSGELVNLGVRSTHPVVIYCYPRTGRPDAEALGGTSRWNAIPGARGCTPQTCGYRDSHAEFSSRGALVYGISTQDTEYQLEAVKRLQLPFQLLSDERLELSMSLGLPRFEVEGIALLKRVTLVIVGGRIAQCFYPVFPPDADATKVLDWLRANG